MSRCKHLTTAQEYVDAPHLVAPSDQDSIDKIEGCLNNNCLQIHPLFSKLEYSSVQDTDIRQVLECYVNLPDMNLVGENPLNLKTLLISNKPTISCKY